MNKILPNIAALTFLIFIFVGCSASTGSRYETKSNDNDIKDKEEQEKFVEDFDITPYKTEIDIEEVPSGNQVLPDDVWYGYTDTVSTSSKIIAGTTDGYRVQVLSTDNMDKANQVRAEIYFNTKNKEVYITFEPPFYKVKAGDFTSHSEANDFKFKLNQLGYPEARVIQETVNIFE
ncbi:MAG: SPOR domain-containing protein [Ignavibacteriaceae bacterium]|jgi:hypothetical protein